MVDKEKDKKKKMPKDGSSLERTTPQSQRAHLWVGERPARE